MTIDALPNLIPKTIRASLRKSHRAYVFGKALKRLRTLSEDATIDRDLMMQLVYGWGNPGWSMELEYAQAILRFLRKTEGPILECGSGLSTIMISLLNRDRHRQLWCLEHSKDWADKVRETLHRIEVDRVMVCHTALRSFGDYSWYTVPAGLPNAFGLVICDGPPADAPGGRYGLVPVLREHLATGAIVLLDDVGRDEERSILKKWSEMTNGRVATEGRDFPYGILEIPTC